MAEKDVVDTYGPVELYSEMVAEFGARHSVSLVGWMILFGATGRETRAGMVERLVASGLSRSAVYRAAADIGRFRERLEKKRGRDVTVQEMAEEAKKVDLSQNWEVRV